MTVMTSTFNERFTELANEMDETSQYKKWEVLARETGIPQKTLRKYYIGKHDDDDKENRITMPKLDVIIKLADYFKVDPLYLAGYSDVRNADVNAILKAKNATGIVDVLLENVMTINDYTTRSTYIIGLAYLLQDIQGDGKNDTRQPYHLLYLIGKYFTYLHGLRQSVVSPADIKDLQLILSRQNVTPATMKDMLEKIANGSTDQESDPSLQLLNEIMDELKVVRSYIDQMQEVVLKALVEQCKKQERNTIDITDLDESALDYAIEHKL